MLTLKEPIPLQTAAGRITVHDDFSDRIRENYNLLSVQFTPKDLLLLMSAPPEETEEPPGMTTLVTQNNVSMYQGVSLEVINHIVNRILLTQNTPFTYQDTVYISSMLRKAGITDVSLFMRQVRQLFAQSESINRLTVLYQLYQSRQTAEGKARGTHRHQAASMTQAEGEETTRERYFLHSDIYRRLQTAEIYREVGALLTSTMNTTEQVGTREMRLAEHFRVNSQLRLAELRQHTVDRGKTMTLQYLQNHYESGDLLPAPQNEEQVFSRLAEAVVYNTVEKSLAIALHRGVVTGGLTLDLRQALQQSIDNTVFRFENCYMQAPLNGGITLQRDERSTTQLTQESHLLEQLLNRNEQTQQVQMQLGDMLLQQTQQALSLTMLPPSGGEIGMIELPVEELQETLREQFDRLDQTTRDTLEQYYQQRVREIRQRHGKVSQLQLQQILTETLHTAETVVHDREQTEQANTVSEHSTLAHHAREVLEQIRQMRSTYQSEHSSEQISEVQTEHLVESERQEKSAQRQTVQAETHTLREQLDLIDRRNREMLERVQRARIQEIRQQRSETRQADTGRVINDALRALDHPEQVLGELLAQPVPERPTLQLSPDAQTLLSQADEPTRRMLEAVMQYEADPSAGLPLQLQSATPAAFNAAAAQTEISPEELVHITLPDEAQQTLVHEAAQEVVRHALPQQVVRDVPQANMSPAPLPLVHKTEQHAVSEELLEQLEQQRQTVRQLEQTQVTEKQERVETQQIEQTQRKTVERMSEDVTELINRTLARQLGTISDKVYSQMEKRLRMERIRRGR